jgi:hypothetical protein
MLLRARKAENPESFLRVDELVKALVTVRMGLFSVEVLDCQLEIKSERKETKIFANFGRKRSVRQEEAQEESLQIQTNVWKIPSQFKTTLRKFPSCKFHWMYPS